MKFISTVTAFFCAASLLPPIAMAAGPAPYAQALDLVREMEKTPDGGRLHFGQPLTPETSEFLKRHEPVFRLLHAGAVEHETDWGVAAPSAATMQSVLDELNGVRGATELEVLRARQRFVEDDFPRGQEDMLDALALNRAVDHGHPILVVALVTAADDGAIIKTFSQFAANADPAARRSLARRLKELAPPPSMARVMRAEHEYSKVSGTPPGVVDDIAPFYDYVAGELDKNPTPTPEEFQRILDDGKSRVGLLSVSARMLIKILAPSLARGYASIAAANAQWAVFCARVDRQ